MHHAVVCSILILILVGTETRGEDSSANGGEFPEKRAWNNFQGSYGKRAWNHFNAGYGKRAWNRFSAGYGKRGWNSQFAGGYGKRSLDYNDDLMYEEYPDEVNELERGEKRAWNSGFAGGMGKRAWNSGFTGAMGKRAWNSGFTGAMGKRAWNSGFSGAMGKRAWNSGFTGAMGKRAWNSGFTGAMGKRFDLEEEYEDEPILPAAKRNWSSIGLRGAWGKRSAQKFMLMSHDDFNQMMLDKYSKKNRGWVALRGMWGKRSDPSVAQKNSIPKVSEAEAEKIIHGERLTQN